MQRTAPQFRQHAAGTCGLAEKYNMVVSACGTLAARRWLPQALALPTFFATLLSNGQRLRLRWDGIYIMMETMCNCCSSKIARLSVSLDNVTFNA